MKKYFVFVAVALCLGFTSCSDDEPMEGQEEMTSYQDGTFVLNEGNMSNETGTLVYISPKGVVTDSAYYRVNKTLLGNVCQDLFIANQKIYIISQNGARNGGEGLLTVANAATLKKEVVYNDEFSGTLSMPSNLAVVGNTIYIRDNKGVYQFNTSSKELTFVNGSTGALKNRMAVVGDKVFVPANRSVYVIQNGTIVHTISMPGTVSGVVKAKDGNLWVSCTTTPAKIQKVNPANYTTLQTNELDVKVGAGYGASPGISAKGDTLYFSNATTKIYRHIFSTKETTYLTDVKDHIENAGVVYNNLAVNPVSGEVFFNTIKGYGMNYLINDITVFNFEGATPALKADYKNLNSFPAGIYFTYDFK